jgi:peptide/nickel transport system substrate-binding protein
MDPMQQPDSTRRGPASFELGRAAFLRSALLWAVCVLTVSTAFAIKDSTKSAPPPALGAQVVPPRAVSAPAIDGAPIVDAPIVDEFHPDRRRRPDGSLPPLPKPAYGGRAILHIESMPKTLCLAIENGAVLRRIAYELNETLLLRNLDTNVLECDLCTSFDVEDTLVTQAGPGEHDKALVFGRIREDGDDWVVTPVSKENPLKSETRVPKAGVLRVDRGTVFTFRLRSDVTWHDGHPFDARDVWFSWSLYTNPTVHCDSKRFQFTKIRDAIVLDAHTIRFDYAVPYFQAPSSLGDLFLLPSHLYDLDDPDNVAADPEFHAAKKASDPAWKPTAEEKGRYVNENRHNREFVGLGPYRLSSFGTDAIEAVRYDGYFDRARAGYLDTLRWRAIPDLTAAFQALLNGDLDFFDTVTTDDYFSDTANSKTFTERFYKGTHETSIYWYVGWNNLRPQFSDPRVRRAMAMLFDFDEFKNGFYHGLATQITGPFPLGAPAYDRTIAPIAYDPKRAVALLAEAGWYDRDGDGLLDKDGVPFTFELLMQPTNAVGAAFGAKFQENLARVGIRLTPRPLEWNALSKKRETGEFDAVALGWAPPYESDPEQLWHSRWGKAKDKGSNYIGFQDAVADELIEAGQRELDVDKRSAIWRKLHARLYELQPYLFCFNTPRKFAMSRALRGFQSVAGDPNFVARRWYYPEGTPGTRATAARSAK